MLIIASQGRLVLLCVSLCSDIYDLILNSLRISSRLISADVGALGVNQDNVAVVDHPAVAVFDGGFGVNIRQFIGNDDVIV